MMLLSVSFFVLCRYFKHVPIILKKKSTFSHQKINNQFNIHFINILYIHDVLSPHDYDGNA